MRDARRRTAWALALGAALGLAAAALCVSSAPAQEAVGQSAVGQSAVGQVNGSVLGKDRKGVPGLTVAAIAPASGALYGTSTDESGHYAFKGLEANTYSIVIVLPGDGVSRKDGIRVRPLFRSIVDFNLGAETPDPPAASLPEMTLAPAGSDPSSTIAVPCLLSGIDRAPAPDASVVLTPMDGSGQRRQCRSGADGRCVLGEVPAGSYRVTAKAPGFITWSLGPMKISGTGAMKLSLLLVPFPMGFEGTLEDKLVPADPIPPGNP